MSNTKDLLGVFISVPDSKVERNDFLNILYYFRNT